MRRRILLGLLAVCAAAPLHVARVEAQAPTCNGKTATAQGSHGTAGDDVFVGTESNDAFYAGEGNDTMCGGGGNDRLHAGPGDDYLDGGDGNDRLSGCSDPFQTPESCDVGDEGDADTFVGGAGDDALFSFGDDDSLDGGAGFDAVDAGNGTDSCSFGERYEGCETTDPAEQPAECSDDADNDGDGYPDDTDPDCDRPRDPTEDDTDDPACFNGNDDDGDGYRDYPADQGCASMSDNGEYECFDTARRATTSAESSCVRPSIYARYSRERQLFRGGIVDVEGCRANRLVLVKRLRKGANEVVARARASAAGRWRVRWSGPRDVYVAVAPRSHYTTPEGDEPVCHKLRSQAIWGGGRRP